MSFDVDLIFIWIYMVIVYKFSSRIKKSNVINKIAKPVSWYIIIKG